MEFYNKYSKEFKTGDLLLFNNDHLLSPTGIFSYLIKFFTKSDWSHIGMIVKDPEFTDVKLPKGLYLWQSSLESFPDAEQHKIKLAVQLSPLDEMIQNFNGIVEWRALDSGNITITNEHLKEIHKLVHSKKYDLNPIDWIEAYIESSINPKKVNRFFCSALVARIYSYLNLIDPNINWSIIRPSSFSSENMNDKLHIKLINNAKLQNEVLIKNT